MKTKLSLIALFCIVFLLNNCSKDEDDPVDSSFNISAITPESGWEGTVVAITGVGFSINAEENIVKFNGVEAEVEIASETGLVVTVPAGATTGKITVTRDGKTANGPVFTITTPTVTETYYIKFKADGVLKIFQTSNPGYQSCGNCACSGVPPLASSSADVSICNDDNDWVTAAHIQGWNGDKILFTGSFPLANFSYSVGDDYYSSEYVANQTGSEVNITAVAADVDFVTKKQFKVTGNFKCKVATDGGATINITEGTFVTRYAED